MHYADPFAKMLYALFAQSGYRNEHTIKNFKKEAFSTRASFKFFAGAWGHLLAEPATGRVSSPTGKLNKEGNFEMHLSTQKI